MNEVNYKVYFAEKYFSKASWEFDVLKEVDILLKDKKNNYILYIESKYIIANQNDLKKALAQTILTNKKQSHILSTVALIYKNDQNDDVMELIDCSDDSIMYNNDINWKQEKPSNPTYDAIERINDRIKNKRTTYTNQEIKEVCDLLINKSNIKINITLKNINIIYNQWKNSIEFAHPIQNEQDLINLFLVDALDGAQYKQKVFVGISETEQNLMREGTYLNKYVIEKATDKIRIIYDERLIYTIIDVIKYDNFWKKYQRPPEKQEFLNILERSATLYSDKYRKDTGGEYTPSSFVEKQNEILQQKGYNINDFIIVDTCAGVGNLENQFGIEFKKNCYLSTLEANDVEICKLKGFENTIQYDYLKNNEQPKWKYQGQERSIEEICKLENKKLMVIINPPYQRKKGFKNNLAIEFFNKIIQLNPQVIVFYYQTESFLRDEIEHYIKSKYKIVSHVMSNAKETFKLSEWPISQVIFDKDKGDKIDKAKIKIDRYEVNPKTDKLDFKNTYIYNNSKPNLTKEIEKEIKKHKSGLILGNYTYMSDINLTNKPAKSNYTITTDNLKYCLLLKGINFNTHPKYFEKHKFVYKGILTEIKEELFNDAIMFSLFYKNCAFTNKGIKNYIMPFTSKELGCNKNDLNVLRGESDLATDKPQPPFDFREWLGQFNFSLEAKELYKEALQVFLYYHKCYKNTDYNDSFYDITNTIMGKDINKFTAIDKEKDTRILYRVKTTKGKKGFGEKNIKSVVESKDLPIFYNFFEKRDILAKKINKQLVDSGLLLWERENIY